MSTASSDIWAKFKAALEALTEINTVRWWSPDYLDDEKSDAHTKPAAYFKIDELRMLGMGHGMRATSNDEPCRLRVMLVFDRALHIEDPDDIYPVQDAVISALHGITNTDGENYSWGPFSQVGEDQPEDTGRLQVLELIFEGHVRDVRRGLGTGTETDLSLNCDLDLVEEIA